MTKKTCTRCKGEKVILVPTFWNPSICDYVMEEEDCPQCKGLGRLVTFGQEPEFDPKNYYKEERKK